MSENIPFDLQLAIMNRLPVKSLLQFRTVSKSWKYSIDCSDFVREYGFRESNNCCLYLTFKQNFEGVICSVDDNLALSPVVSNLKFFNLTPFATSEGQAVVGGKILWVGSEKFYSDDGATNYVNAFVALKLECLGDNNNFLKKVKTLEQVVSIVKSVLRRLFEIKCDSENPISTPRQNYYGCGFFLWKEERVGLLINSPGSSSTTTFSQGTSSTPSFSPTPSTPPIYYRGSSSNTECSNCKHLLRRIKLIFKAKRYVYLNTYHEAWVSATSYVNAFGGTVTGCLGDIDNFLKEGKLEQVVSIIKSCSLNALGDLNVTLKDLSGAAMILANVLVFTPKPSKHYFNFTKRKVVDVFRKDTVLGSGSG
ncbi:transposase, MuDR, MULE transposase domain protein [Tanacetum coccineum]